VEASFENDRLYNVQIDIYISQNRRFTYLVWSLLTTLFIWNQKFRNSFVSTVTSYIHGYHWMLEQKMEKLYSALLSQHNRTLIQNIWRCEFSHGWCSKTSSVWQTIQIPFEFLGDALSCRAALSILWCQLVSLPSYVLLYVQTPSVYAMMYIGPCSVCTRCMQVCTQCMQVCTRCMQVYTECMQVCTRCMQVHTECMQVSTRSVSNSVSLYTNICSSVICVVNIENFDVLSQWRMDLICRPDH